MKKKKTLDPIVLRSLPPNRRRIIERTSIDVQFSTLEKGNESSLVRKSFTIYHPDCFHSAFRFSVLHEPFLQEATITIRQLVQEIPVPELPERVRLEMHVEEAFAERVRPRAAIQVSTLRLPWQMEGEHMQTHQESPQELQHLRFRHLVSTFFSTLDSLRDSQIGIRIVRFYRSFIFHENCFEADIIDRVFCRDENFPRMNRARWITMDLARIVKINNFQFV